MIADTSVETAAAAPSGSANCRIRPRVRGALRYRAIDCTGDLEANL